MANVVTIEAEVRARSGKGAARATRRAGKVPAVIYGARQEPNLIALDPRVVIRELHRAGWQSRLYEIAAGGEPVKALIRGVQFHPVSDAPEHVDFQRLVAGQRIKVAVPVHFENDGISPGIKRGAVLNVVRHAVEVYCDAENIPEQFTADLGPLDFNDNVRWHDLKGTENVKSVIDRDFVVATVVPPTKIEVVAEAGAAGAPSAAAAPAKGGARAPGKAPPKK
jgi:large subunit ribosomal protein L25